MDEDYDEGFFSIDQLLREEGLQETQNQDQPDAWAEAVVRAEAKNLTNNQRRFIVHQLLLLKNGEALPRGSQTKIARHIGVHKSTISQIFKKAEQQRIRGEDIDVSSKIKGNSGRKPTECSEDWLQSAPLHLRCTYRAYAGYLKCSHTHIRNLLKKGKLRVHTSSNHPSVTEKHKIERMKWCLANILPATPTSKPTFWDMDNVIHIDEKWFFINPDMRRFYLLPKEVDPYRTCQSRNYKIKLMFMGVTSRPLYDENGHQFHDGKFGIYHFIFKQRAKNKSKNRAAGTLETKAVTSVTQEVIRDMLLTKVLPDVMQKWPERMTKNIFIQQDNARPHIHPDDPQFVQAANQNGFNIKLVYQPPQSPDLNVLDLAQFRAFQSIQYQSFPKNMEDLIEKVKEAYDAYDSNMMKYNWLQLQWVMVEILKVKGGNNYKMPHHNKARLERIGELPKNVEVDEALIDEAVEYLLVHDQESMHVANECDMEIDAV